jgi:acetylornithine aminotransferase
MKPAPHHPALDALPVNLMVQLEEKKRALHAAGKRIFDFGLGDPLEPTPLFIREALRRAVPETSQYPLAAGTPALRDAAASYLKRRFGVVVDPATQVMPASGAKETIFHLPVAFNGDPRRDTVVFPDPGYPTYEAGTRLAGLSPHRHALTPKNRFLLEPADVPAPVLARTLLFWICYPHNPTGAVADKGYLARVAAAARQHGFIVVSDECYADIYFDLPPPSILEVASENVLAIHSCSKRSGMTGYRSGFVAGDPDLIAVLKRFRPHAGVASPDFVSMAATAAWHDDAHVAERRAVFAKKREAFIRFFARSGIVCDSAPATLYLWVRVPPGETSLSYAERLLGEGIVVTPGTGFGAGEGYVRVALVPTLSECEEAIGRWERIVR